MKVVQALALAGLLCVASAARHLTLTPVLKKDSQDFDYFLLVRQWPGNYCSKHACPLLHDHSFHFTVHGLWPNYFDGTWPQFCQPDYKFDERELQDLLHAMEQEWPSFFSSDETFWEHEWSKHGTCALDVLKDEHKFFKTVLKLHWRYDLAAALRKANIVPRDTTVYRNTELVKAVEDMYGVRPLVHCYGKALSEVWMCFDKDLKPFSCDASHEPAGCDELTIPPLDHSSSGRTDTEGARSLEQVAEASATATTATPTPTTTTTTAGASTTAAKADALPDVPIAIVSIGAAAGPFVDVDGSGDVAAASEEGFGSGQAAGPQDSIFDVLSGVSRLQQSLTGQLLNLLEAAGKDEGAARRAFEAASSHAEDSLEVAAEARGGGADAVQSGGGADAVQGGGADAVQELAKVVEQVGNALQEALQVNGAVQEAAQVGGAVQEAAQVGGAVQEAAQAAAGEPGPLGTVGAAEAASAALPADSSYAALSAAAQRAASAAGGGGGLVGASDDVYGTDSSYVDWTPEAAAGGEAQRPQAGGWLAGIWQEWPQQVRQTAAFQQAAAAAQQQQRPWSVAESASQLADRAAAAMQRLAAQVGASVGGGGQAGGRVEPCYAAGAATDAAAGTGGAEGPFVWQSRLRAGGSAFSASEGEDGLGAGAGGAAGTMLLDGSSEEPVAVVSDGDGELFWAVSGVVVARGGGGGGGGGAGARSRPFDWVAFAQMACVAVITVSVVALVGMTLVGLLQGGHEEEEEAEAAEAAQRGAGAGGATALGARVARCGGHAELGVPLLVGGGGGGAAACARGAKGGPCGREEEEEEDGAAVLRTGIVVVVPLDAPYPPYPQQQQQQGQHAFAPLH